MDKSMVRKIALGLTIFFDVTMLAFWALAGHWGFFWTFAGITLVVIVFEVVNSLWWYGKSLSTEAKHKIEAGGKTRTLIYLAIICMCLAIGSLADHLGVV